MAEASGGEERLRRIWRTVRAVPRGRVATYGDIAARAGCGAREVGRALSMAPPALRLPWHRIVAAGGRIALPAEAGNEQRLRLEAEGVGFRGRRVRLEECRWRPGGAESSARRPASARLERPEPFCPG